MSLQDKLKNSAAGSTASIVREIQRDLIDEQVPLSSALRKARLAARKLDLKEFLEWINNESDGYKVDYVNELPRYRKIGITPRFHNPYAGWRPILTDDARLYELLTSGFIHQSVEEVETLCNAKGQLAYTYSNELTSLLRKQMDYDFEIRGFAGASQMKGVLNSVRNILLDWAVDLERAGVLGEGLGFSTEDKTEAAMVTQTIYAQNIGNLGNVAGQASINNTLSGNTFSLSSIDDYTKQIEGALPGLPDSVRGTVEAELRKIKAAKGSAKSAVVKSALASIRKVCEGAATSLAAQGVAAFLAHIL